MQFIFNIFFLVFSQLFDVVGGDLVAPDWFMPLFTELAYYYSVANYYLPIQELASVSLGVLSAHLILMVISAVLQLL